MKIKLLKKLSEFEAISAYEKDLTDFISANLDQDLIQKKDGLGSLIVKQQAHKPKVMIATHIDEVGFMVKEISDDGFIFFQAVGSFWSHLIAGQKMKIITQDKKCYLAIVGSLPTHGISKKLKAQTMNLEDLYLDLGVKSKEKVLKMGINIGDMIVFDTTFQKLNDDGCYIGKALDNRVSVFILMEILNAKLLDVNLTGAFSVQEEVGLRGARTTTHLIKPDIAFAIDTTLAGDTPLTNNVCKLGNGVVLSMLDSNSIAPRKLVHYLRKLCLKNKIKFQYAVFNDGGTDSGNIHKSFDGILNMTISIPIRYMHSCYSIIHIDDVKACIKLLKCVLKDLTYDKLKELL